MRAYVPLAPGRDLLAASTLAQLGVAFPHLEPYIVTDARTFESLARRSRLPLQFVDESIGVDGLTIQAVRDAMPISAKRRSGWYFQQFIKFQVSLGLTDEYYAVVDADTFFLRPLPLFDPQDPSFIVKTEHHQPYFDTIRSLLGLEKVLDLSFIAECMLLKTGFVREILTLLGAGHPLDWWRRVLGVIPAQHLEGAGFSEYETYGTFVSSQYPGSYRLVTPRVLRASGLSFGERPGRSALRRLSQDYDIATFERHRRVGPLAVLKNRLLAHLGRLGHL